MKVRLPQSTGATSSRSSSIAPPRGTDSRSRRAASDVVGICFGSPSAKGGDEAELRGIAVAAASAGRGIGSVLLERFEAAVRRASYTHISVGSAPGYVERFYLSHGYEQREVMVRMPPGVPAPDSEGLNILRRRAIGGCEAFNIPADGYAPEANRELKRRLGAAEVIGVFRKTLPPRAAALSGDARL